MLGPQAVAHHDVLILKEEGLRRRGTQEEEGVMRKELRMSPSAQEFQVPIGPFWPHRSYSASWNLLGTNVSKDRGLHQRLACNRGDARAL